MMSLQMVLAGLFPPENTPMEWNLMLNWQPIPIMMEPEETDVVSIIKCINYNESKSLKYGNSLSVLNFAHIIFNYESKA